MSRYESILDGLIRHRAIRGMSLDEVTMARLRKQARDMEPSFSEFFDNFDGREFRRQCREDHEDSD